MLSCSLERVSRCWKGPARGAFPLVELLTRHRLEVRRKKQARAKDQKTKRPKDSAIPMANPDLSPSSGVLRRAFLVTPAQPGAQGVEARSVCTSNELGRLQAPLLGSVGGISTVPPYRASALQ